MNTKTRSVCFTLNNYTEDEYQSICNLECVYLVVGKETGESGTPHLQGFISFTNRRSLQAVKVLLGGRSHVEAKVGTSTFLAASSYCKKEDHAFFEKGVLPLDPAEKGKKEKDRWDTAILAAAEKRWEDVDSQIGVSHHNGLISMAAKRHKRKLENLDRIDNEWHYGDPHSGKSETRDQFPGCYVKLAHAKWWDNYDDEEVVFIDDFSDRKLVDEMISFADKYPVRVEIKGGSTLIRPKRVIVTSQFRPGSYTEDAVRAAALERRFTLVQHRFNPNYIPPPHREAHAPTTTPPASVGAREGRDPPAADAPGRAT